MPKPGIGYAAGAGLVLCVVLMASATAEAQRKPRPLDPLYQRIARDLEKGKPLVITVHVALCDNNSISCGGRGSGDGDVPRRNLYWGKAGIPAWFTRARGFRRIFKDGGDGKKILERVAYRRRVRRPSYAWRRLGVTRGFEVVMVALAYRGSQIDKATDAFISQVLQQKGQILSLKDGTTIHYGGAGHVVGYAGHNHMLDISSYEYPPTTRTEPVGFFNMSCWSAQSLARRLKHPRSHVLLMSLTRLFPGPFVIEGLVRGLAAAEPQHKVCLRGMEGYARNSKSTVKRLRYTFIHGQERRFKKRFGKASKKK